MTIQHLSTLLISILFSAQVFANSFKSNADRTYREYKNSLTFHVISSPYGIDWNENKKAA